jgi:hypothetical protein
MIMDNWTWEYGIGVDPHHYSTGRPTVTDALPLILNHIVYIIILPCT